MNKEETVLQMEGVLAKGYGCIAKFAMQDPELGIIDKGLYAYLVSLAGGGLTTWPTRKTILSQLNICKTSYYKAQKNLLDHGYLKLEHQRKQGRWARAVYTICLNPKKYQEREAGKASPPGRSVVTSSTMLSSGYGLLPKAVMQDERFGAKEKAVYAYFVTYANVGTMAYPIQEAVERELGITNNAFKIYLKKLTDYGYIIVKNRREKNGRFGVCDYYLTLIPFEDGASAPNGEYTYYEPWRPNSPDPSKWDTVETAKEPDPSKWDTVDSDRTPQNGTRKNGTRENGTRENRTQSNTTMSNTTMSNTISFKEEEDRAAPPPEQQQVNQAVQAARGIPKAFEGKAPLTRMAIQALVGCNPFSQEYEGDERKAAAWELAVKAFGQLCTRQRSRVRENGRLKTVTRQQVIDLFNASCVEWPERYGAANAKDFFCWLAEEYLDALEDRNDNAKGPLSSPLAYARFVVWTAMQSWEAKKEQKAERNIANSTAFAYYQNKIGVSMSSETAGLLFDYIKRMGDEVVIAAIDEALDAGAKNWNYVKKVLKSWSAAQVHDKDSLNLYRERFRESKKRRAAGRNPGKAIGPAPYVPPTPEEAAAEAKALEENQRELRALIAKMGLSDEPNGGGEQPVMR